MVPQQVSESRFGLLQSLPLGSVTVRTAFYLGVVFEDKFDLAITQLPLAHPPRLPQTFLRISAYTHLFGHAFETCSV